MQQEQGSYWLLLMGWVGSLCAHPLSFGYRGSQQGNNNSVSFSSCRVAPWYTLGIEAVL